MNARAECMIVVNIYMLRREWRLLAPECACIPASCVPNYRAFSITLTISMSVNDELSILS